MRRVLIVEDDPEGHRLVYVGHLVRYGVERGDSVTVAVSRRVLDADEWRAAAAELPAGVEVVPLVSELTVQSLAVLSRSCGADVTIVPDADRLTMRLGAGRGWRGCGVLSLLVMRDPIERPISRKHRLGRAVKLAALRLAGRRRGVRVAYLRSALAPARADRRTAPDPVDVAVDPLRLASLPDEWGLTNECFWFAVVGAIGERKNLPLVVSAMEVLHRQVPDRIGLLVAGPMDAATRTATADGLRSLASSGVEVKVIDRLLPPDDVVAAIGCADCVIAAHTFDMPSLIVATTAAVGTRLLTAGAASLRRDVQHLPAARWTELDAPAMAAAMADLMAIAGPIEPVELGTTEFCAVLYGDV